MSLKLVNFSVKSRLFIFSNVLISPFVSVNSLAAHDFNGNNPGVSKLAALNTQNASHTNDALKTKNIVASNPFNSGINAATVNLVKQYEGFRSYAYIDTSGYPVIGYGQSRIYGRTVTMGQYVTQAQADAALTQELDHIQRIVQSNVKVQLTPNQLGALTSLVYNAGTRVIKSSTLARKLNAGDYAGAAREFTRWNKANQGGRLVALPGLTKRRIAEQKLFLTP